MPVFTPTSLADTHPLTAEDLNNIQADIAAAFNQLDGTNFDDDTVPTSALVNQFAYFSIILTHVAAVGVSQAYTTARSESVVPADASCTIIGVSAVTADTPTNSPKVKVYVNGSAVTAAITLAAARTVYDVTPSPAAIAAGNLVELRFETGGTDDVSGVAAMIWCKKTLST